MFGAIVSWSIRFRAVVLLLSLVAGGLGLWAFTGLPIDALPDLTNTQVQVLTSAPSLGALDVERIVTAPVEQALTGISGVQEIRSVSRYGVSAVTVVFREGVDPWFARAQVAERMARARAVIPSVYGEPELGPPTTGLGEIYQFEVHGEGRTPMELRSILDWEIAPRLRMTPGIVEVNTFGGELRTYEVAVDPGRLLAHGVSLQDLFSALERNNRATGGGAIVRGPEALLVRGDALVSSLQDVAETVIAVHGDVPVLVKHVGTVSFAPMLRQGAASRDGRGEAVVGMAIMLRGENARTVAAAVQAETDELNRVLPRGVRIEPFYDRQSLVEHTLHTVRGNLLEGGLLVVLVLVALLANVRAALIAAAVIPLAMLIAFSGMRALGLSGNLMSLGAIDFGLVVDGAIILLENAIHHLADKKRQIGRDLSPGERDAVVLHAAMEVRSATAFGEFIIAIVYVPVLALEGVEGRLFRPMILTVLLALAGAFVLSLTFVPALASWVLSRRTVDRASPVVTLARRLYEPVLEWTIRRPRLTLAAALAVLAGTGFVGRSLGSEFVPTLDEGTLVIEMVQPPSASLEQSLLQTRRIEGLLRAFPEVATVVSKIGRPEIANDPMGIEAADIYVVLRPRDQWRAPRTLEGLVERIDHTLAEHAPGVAYGFTQPIQMRTNELISGVRTDIAVKIYGEDLGTLARLGERIARVLSRVPGARDIRVDRVTGLPVLRAQIDREAAARHGVAADDALQAIETIGGTTVGTVLEERRRYPLRVRLDPAFRADLEAIRRLPVRTGDGAMLPLGALARLETVDEPSVIQREKIQRRIVVQANVRGRDLGGFADEAQEAVARAVHPPTGYRLEWGGQFENLRRARSRLEWVVPMALGIILAALYLTFRNARAVALIACTLPFAAVGGVLALATRGLPFSISAGVGFVALFGVAVLNGLVMVNQILVARGDGLGGEDAAREGALRRLRPVLTTALVASLGFVPMALARSEGSEVQRPLATVVIGGLVTSTLLTLVVLPTLAAKFGLGRRDGDPPDADEPLHHHRA